MGRTAQSSRAQIIFVLLFHFKRQEGHDARIQQRPLKGSVDGKNISFHVATRVPLDYKGTVDGDTMKGSMTGKGKTGDWAATRAK